MKGKQRSLNGLFWRYLLSTMALLAGVEEQHVYEAGERLLTDAQLYHAMAHAINPYGDGHTSEKIAQIILDWGRARRKRP